MCEERKKGKRVAVKGKFVSNTKTILEVGEKAEVEASKGKSEERRTTRAANSQNEDGEEEDI
jgi:hypothetical protein